jgi:hypothetical protein
MPTADDSERTWCATGTGPFAGDGLFHNVTAAQIAEYCLTVTHCPDHDPDETPPRMIP